MVAISNPTPTERVADLIQDLVRVYVPIAVYQQNNIVAQTASSFRKMPFRSTIPFLAISGIAAAHTFYSYRKNDYEAAVRENLFKKDFLSMNSTIQPLADALTSGVMTFYSFFPFFGKHLRRFAPYALAATVLVSEVAKGYDSFFGVHSSDGETEKFLRSSSIGFSLGVFLSLLSRNPSAQSRFFSLNLLFVGALNIASVFTEHHGCRIPSTVLNVEYADRALLPSVCPTDHLLTGKEIVEEHNYGPIGYYSRKDFHRFDYASLLENHSPHYGQMIAGHVKKIYEKMRANGQISEVGRFSVYEQGGWDGKLARDFLQYVRKRAVEDGEPSWQAFYAALEYHGVEISPTGVQLQKKLEEEFPGKFFVHQGDAKTYRPKNSIRGVVFSSLMADSFPGNHIVNTKVGFKAVLASAQFLFTSEEERQSFLKRHFPREETKILKESDLLRRDCFSENQPAKNILTLFLNKNRFQQLQTTIAGFYETDPEQYRKSLKFLNERMAFTRGLGSISSLQGVEEFIKHHPYYERAIYNNDIHLNTDVDPYVENVRSYLEEGVLMVLDIFMPPEAVEGQFPSLTAQRVDEGEMLQQVEGFRFGKWLVYQGLYNGDWTKLFARGRTSFRPQESLWEDYEGDKKEAIEKAYQNIIDRTLADAHARGIKGDPTSDDLKFLREKVKSQAEIIAPTAYQIFEARVGSGWKVE